MKRSTRVMLLVILFSTLIIEYAISADKDPTTYEKDVKPILTGCMSCHGSDSPMIDEFVKNKEGLSNKRKGQGWTPMKTS